MLVRDRILFVLLTGVCTIVGCSGGGPTVTAHSNPWFSAASSGSQGDLDAAAKSGANVNDHERSDRNTPLHTAAIAGNVEAVRFILAHGGAIDALDEDGRTALMMALYYSRGPVAAVLVNAGANLEIRDHGDNTALMFAARKGQVEAIQAMIGKKVNLDVQNENGKAALHFAAEYDQADAARVLKAAGASVTVRDRRGRTPVDYAVTKNYPDVLRVLRPN